MARKFTFKILKSEENEESGIDLRVVEFTAHEWISAPYIVNLKLASEDEIDFDKVIAKEALLTILGNNQIEERYFHGIINKFIKTGSEGRFFFYEAVMVPNLWRLTLMQDCRIFQGLPVLRKDENTPIVNQILKDANILTDRYEIRTQESYDDRDYCAQYRETDLNFISRILEEEGIFYFFEHSNDKHLLVFGDSTACYNPIPGKNEVEFRFSDSMVSEEDFVYGFKLSQQIHSGKVSLRDFDFSSPSNFPTEEKEDSYKKLEIYDYPGGYIKNETPNNADKATIKKDLAKIRLQEAAIFAERAEGESVCPRFVPGHTFTLTKHAEFPDPEYLLIEVIHTGNQPQALEERSGHRNKDKGFSYANSFIGIPSQTPFRSQRKTPKAVVRGPQTAIIVDSEGKTDYNSQDPQAPENVYTDDYGRVKARFHWERSHKVGEDDKWHNTAWVRVSQAWAGEGWGSMHIPHVGQEVIVDFLEGDPDRPIITGRVYNGANKPHHTSASDTMNPSVNRYISGFRDEYGNKLTFDATSDNEEVILGSPNNTSLLKLGKSGAELSTTKDKWQSVLGNITEYGAGLKSEVFAGAELSGKLAACAEIIIGQTFELMLGHKFEVGLGIETEYKRMPEVKWSAADIREDTKRDYVLSSGDGFSISGGTIPQNGDDQHSSIINAYGKALSLSYGKRREKSKKIEYKAIGTNIAFFVAMISTFIAASATKGFQVAAENFDQDHLKFWQHSATVTSGIFPLLYTVLTWIFTRTLLKDEQIEPNYHEKPTAEIGLTKDGIILSVEPDIPPVLSIPNLNALIKKGEKAQEARGIAPIKTETWDEVIQSTLDEKTPTKSKMMMKNDGSIMINSNGDKKEISIQVGEGESVGKDIRLSLLEKKLKLNSGESFIEEEKDGDIEINTAKKNKKITLDSGGGDVIIKGSKVDVAGSAFTKASVDVLKSLKVIK